VDPSRQSIFIYLKQEMLDLQNVRSTRKCLALLEKTPSFGMTQQSLSDWSAHPFDKLRAGPVAKIAASMGHGTTRMGHPRTTTSISETGYRRA
jgi:hypothetical protein